MSLEAIKDYAVNGAANYLKHAIKYGKGFDSVVGFGCSYSENVGANIIPLYYDKEMFVNDRNPLVLRSVNDFSKFNVYNLSKTIRGIKNPSKADINEIIRAGHGQRAPVCLPGIGNCIDHIQSRIAQTP